MGKDNLQIREALTPTLVLCEVLYVGTLWDSGGGENTYEIREDRTSKWIISHVRLALHTLLTLTEMSVITTTTLCDCSICHLAQRLATVRFERNTSFYPLRPFGRSEQGIASPSRSHFRVDSKSLILALP